MRARKPLLLAVLILALLAVAMVVPAAAVADSGGHNRMACASWEQNIQAPLPYPPPFDGWEATFSVNVLKQDGNVTGSEYMDWIGPELAPNLPPLGQHLTTEIYSTEFKKLGDGHYQATVVYRFDMSQWGEPWESAYPDGVYHKFVLTDNHGRASDHVLIYSQFWEPGNPPPGYVDWQSLIWDADVEGVYVRVR
jgi:hypothetical protein